MERDVTGWLHKGETVPNLVAGLAYSIALNYLNRVVRGRKIGNVIYFQGGTAYNDAVTAAFASLLGKKITVPPYNGVMGAIGMALIARQWHQATRRATRFRGYDLDKLQLATRDFVCKACTNLCDMKEFIIEGQKSYWGDKCSDKFRKPSATGRKPVIDDLFAYREQLLEGARRTRPIGQVEASGCRARCRCSTGCRSGSATSRNSAFETVLSPRDRSAHLRGAASNWRWRSPAIRCRWRTGMCRRCSTRAWITSSLPNMVGCRGGRRPCAAHYCPWNQTLPWVLRSAPALEPRAAPVPDSDAAFPARPRAGEEGAGRDDAAAGRHAAGERSRGGCGVRGAAGVPGEAARRRPARARDCWSTPASPAWCWPGRGYNIYDRGVNCDIPRKLRHRYGANVIPLDFLVTGREPVAICTPNMFWISGPQDPGGGAHRGRAAQSPHGLHHQFQVRARFVHQALRPRGRRRAAAGSPIRRSRQRCRLHDALRSVSGQ